MIFVKLPPGNSPYNSGLPNLLEPIGGTANGIPRNCSTSVPNGDNTTCPLMTPCCVGTSTTSCPERYQKYNCDDDMSRVLYIQNRKVKILKVFIN